MMFDPKDFRGSAGLPLEGGKNDSAEDTCEYCIRFVRRGWRAILYNRFTLFIGIVWRPVTGDEGDTWWQARNKYPLHASDAWAIACSVYPPNVRISDERP